MQYKVVNYFYIYTENKVKKAKYETDNELTY